MVQSRFSLVIKMFLTSEKTNHVLSFRRVPLVELARRAVKWYRKAAEQGNAAAAEQGNAYAQYELAAFEYHFAAPDECKRHTFLKKSRKIRAREWLRRWFMVV